MFSKIKSFAQLIGFVGLGLLAFYMGELTSDPQATSQAPLLYWTDLNCVQTNRTQIVQIIQIFTDFVALLTFLPCKSAQSVSY